MKYKKNIVLVFCGVLLYVAYLWSFQYLGLLKGMSYQSLISAPNFYLGLTSAIAFYMAITWIINRLEGKDIRQLAKNLWLFPLFLIGYTLWAIDLINGKRTLSIPLPEYVAAVICAAGFVLIFMGAYFALKEFRQDRKT